MHPFAAFGISMLARFIGILAEHFAQWVLHRISDGRADFSDLRGFGESFWQMLAGQLCGRSVRYEEEYEFGR